MFTRCTVCICSIPVYRRFNTDAAGELHYLKRAPSSDSYCAADSGVAFMALTTRTSMYLLSKYFHGCLVSLSGDLQCSARSTDLTPRGFFFKGHQLKSLVHTKNPVGALEIILRATSKFEYLNALTRTETTLMVHIIFKAP